MSTPAHRPQEPAGRQQASAGRGERRAPDPRRAIANRIEPPDPMDKDLYDLPPEELARVPQVPASLTESLDALEADNDYLRAGGVFTDDLIETHIAYKRWHEVDPIRLRPHPYEFALYYDI